MQSNPTGIRSYSKRKTSKEAVFVKKLRTYLTLLLVLSLVLPLFSACGTTETGGQTDDSGTAPDGGTVLTNIFSETPLQLPEKARVYEDVIPLYDRESETITEFLLEWEEVTGEDGVITDVYTGWLYTVSVNGELLDKTEVPLPDNFNSLGSGIVLPDAVVCTGSTADSEPVVWKTDRTTGEITSTGPVTELTGDRNFYPTSYAFDAEGRIYGTDAHTVYILNPDLTLSFVYTFPTQIYTMARGADGKVWTVFNAGMEACAAVLDPETKKLGTYHTFTRGMDGALKPTHYLLNSSMNAGESAYNFFYYDKDGALWGVTVTDEGTLSETMVFDLFNSGISELNLGGGSLNGELFPIAFVTDDLFLTWKYNGQGWANRHDILILHHRADNIDMSDQTVLTIAYAYPLEPSIVEHITEFKRTHPDVSIVLEDYSQYAVAENGRAGEEKLCFDLVNGFIEPDLVITDAGVSVIRDDAVMTQIYRNNLYVDLVPYLEKDDELNFGNLFGFVRRLFDDGRGGMWGITTDFDALIMYGSPSLLGDYTGKGYWTLGEMLDFFDTLPEDVEKIYSYNRKQSPRILQGYGYFIKDGTCSFDSEEFIRLLEYMKTVPADYTEYRQTSPVSDIQNIAPNRQDQAVRDAMDLGKIALNDAWFSYQYAHDVLFSETTVPIGYATNSTSGIDVRANDTYIITTYSEAPDLCFELIKSFFTRREIAFLDPLFVRKDHFLPALTELMTPDEIQLMTDEEFRAYCKETGHPYSRRAKAPTPLTDEEIDELFEIFDSMGSPIMEKTPADVENIVKEEMSSYFSGMGTAEDCAKKIQSRVEIWLAEHE